MLYIKSFTSVLFGWRAGFQYNMPLKHEVVARCLNSDNNSNILYLSGRELVNS